MDKSREQFSVRNFRGGNRGNRGGNFGSSRGDEQRQRYQSRNQYTGGRNRTRDIEEELLMQIKAEFVVNCTGSRSLQEIFGRLNDYPDLFRYIKNIDGLRDFLKLYSDYFPISEDEPNIVRWTIKDPVSRFDSKRHRREDRRYWAKHGDDLMTPYDVGLEENALSFIISLFLITNDNWLPTDKIQTAVKVAFKMEVDLSDYVAGDVRKFMIRRNHVFDEHLDMMHFYGQHTYEVVQKLNCFIRDSSTSEDRETVPRVHEFYLTTKTISNEVRDQLKLNDRASFCNFIARSSFVFEYASGNTHIKSLLLLAPLTFDVGRIQRIPSFAEVLGEFKEMYDRSDCKTLVSNPNEPTFVLDANGRPIRLGIGSCFTERTAFDDNDTMSTVTASTSINPMAANRRLDTNSNENSFEKYKRSALMNDVNGCETALASLRLMAGRGRQIDDVQPIGINNYSTMNIEQHKFLRTPGTQPSSRCMNYRRQ